MRAPALLISATALAVAAPASAGPCTVGSWVAVAGTVSDGRDFAGAQFGTFKPALADLAVAKLSPITTEMNRLMADPAEIDRILGDGADRADALARPILEQVYDITGMIRSRRGCLSHSRFTLRLASRRSEMRSVPIARVRPAVP